MATFDYKIKLSVDDAKVLTSFKNLKAQKQELEDGQVLLDFKYNANIKDFNKQFDKIIKANPNLDIQFQYDINKKMLEAEKKKIQDATDIKLAISTGKEMEYLKPLLNEIESIYKNKGLNSDALIAPFKKLKDVIETITSNGGVIKLRNSIFETFNLIDVENNKLGKYKGVSLISEESEMRAKELEEVLSHLIELGASADKKKSNNNIAGISKKELEDIKAQLEKVKQQIKEINEQLSSNTDKSFKDFSTNAKNLREELDKVVNDLNSYKEQVIGLQSLPQDVFDGLTNSAKNLREELEKIATALSSNKDDIKDISSSIDESDSSVKSIDKVVQKIDELKNDLVNGLKINNIEDLASAFGSVDTQLVSLVEKMDSFISQIEIVKKEDISSVTKSSTDKVIKSTQNNSNSSKPSATPSIQNNTQVEKIVAQEEELDELSKAHIEKYRDFISGAESRIKTYTGQINQLKLKANRSSTPAGEVAQANKQIDAKEKDIEKLQKDIEEYQKLIEIFLPSKKTEQINANNSTPSSSIQETTTKLNKAVAEIPKVEEKIAEKINNTAQETEKAVEKTKTSIAETSSDKNSLVLARQKLNELADKMRTADINAAKVKENFDNLSNIIKWYNEAIALVDEYGNNFNQETVNKQLRKDTVESKVKAAVYNNKVNGVGQNKKLDELYSAIIKDVGDTEKLELLKKQQAETDKLAREARNEWEEQQRVTVELENQLSLIGQKQDAAQTIKTKVNKKPERSVSQLDQFSSSLLNYKKRGLDGGESYLRNTLNFYQSAKKSLGLSKSKNTDYFDKYESTFKLLDSKYKKKSSSSSLNKYLDAQIQKASLILDNAQKTSGEAIEKSNEAVESSAKVVDKTANVSKEISSLTNEEVKKENQITQTESVSKDDAIDEVAKAINTKIEAVKKEEVTVNNSVAQEVDDFQRLADFIRNDVVKAINVKIEAFENEGSRVDKIVSDEIEKLELLVKELEKVRENSNINLKFKRTKINNNQSVGVNFNSEELLGIIDSIRPILEVLAKNVSDLGDCVTKFSSIVSTIDFNKAVENVAQNRIAEQKKGSSKKNNSSKQANNGEFTEDNFKKLKGNIASTIKQSYNLLNTAISQEMLSDSVIANYKNNIENLVKVFNEFTNTETPFDLSSKNSKQAIINAQELLDTLKQQNQEYSVRNASLSQSAKNLKEQQKEEKKQQKERNKNLKKQSLEQIKAKENIQKANEIQDIATAYKYLKSTYEEYLRISEKAPESRTEYENELLQKRLEYLKVVQKEESKYYANDNSNRSYKAEDYHYYQNSINEKIAKKNQEQSAKNLKEQQKEEKKDADAAAVKKIADAYKYLRKTYSDWLKIKNKNHDNLTDYEKGVVKERTSAKKLIFKSGYDSDLEKEYKSFTQKENDRWDEQQSKKKEKSVNTLTNLQNKLNETIEKGNKLTLSSNTRYTKAGKDQISNYIEELKQIKNITPDNMQEVSVALKNFDALLRKISGDEYKQASSTKLSNLIGDLSELQRYTNVPKDLQEKVSSLLKVVENAYKNNENVSNIDLKSLISSTVSLKNQVEAVGSKSLGFVDQVKQRLQDMNSKYIAQFFSFQDWIRYGREMLNIIIDIDSAMTELRKVSNATEKELNGALAQATSTAKELGANISDIVNIQADWSRLGYSVEEAEELARVTQLYVNVGDNLTTDTASEYMISTLQGFNIEAENAIEIVDKFNEVANNFAIDTEGLGDALERSAASFTASGTSLSEAIAIVTTANTVVQDSEKVGTAMKTLSARIRGASTELEDLGEEEDEYTKTTSKLRAKVKGLTGFDIMEDENTYKSIYEILLGIGKEWDNLTDVEQASLGEALAGKQNSNVFYSIMQNIDDLEDVYKTAEDAAGSAEKEELNHEKSVQYSLDRIQASAQEWANSLINSDIIKWFVDLGNAIVNISTKFGSLTTIIAGAGIFAGVKNLDGVKKTIESYNSILSVLEGYSKNSVFSEGDLSFISNSLKGLNENQANLILTTKGLDGVLKEDLLIRAGIKEANVTELLDQGKLKEAILLTAASKKMATEEDAKSLILKAQEAGAITLETDGTVKLTKATIAQSVAESTLSDVDKERLLAILTQEGATKLLTASTLELAKTQALAAFKNPATWIMLGVAAIYAAIKFYDKYTISAEEASEGAEKFADSVKTLKKETSENLSTIDDLNDRYQELSKGVNTIGENISLTTSEYEEYKDIMSQVSELMPDLTYYYNEQGEVIGIVGGKLDDLSEKYKKVALEAAKTQLAEKDDEGNLLVKASEQNYENFSTGKDIRLGREDQGMSYQAALDELKKGYESGDKSRRQELEYYVQQVTGENIETIKNASDEAFEIMIDNAIDLLETDLASRFSKFKDGYITNAILGNESYWGLDDDVRGNIDKFTSSLTAETWEALKTKSGESDVGNITQWLIDQFSTSDLQQAWTDLTSLDLSGVKFGDIDSTLKEKAEAIFEAFGLGWDNGGYELLVSLNLIPDDTNYNALKKMLGENDDLADNLTLDQIDTLTSDDFKKWADGAEVNIEKVAESYRKELTDSAQEVLDEEREKAEEWSKEVPGLYEKIYDAQGNYILKQSQFGNVDMDKREIITWTNQLKEQYADALASWNYDPEIGGIDTVFGGWDNFGDEQLPISFTPILVDKDGKNAQFLDANTVYDYINNIVEQSTKDGKIDTDLLLKLDADRDNGGLGLISGVGDEAEMNSMLTHFAGKFGAVQIAIKDMQEVASDDGWAKKLTNAYKIAQRGTEKLSDSLSSITTKIDSFGSLGDIYEDVQDGGEFDYSSIADTDGDFYNTFGNLGQAYEDFIQTIADSPSDISACQRDFDNLATTWVYANGVLDDLDNTNKQATANMLKQNGIQNATEMVNAYISAANTYTEAYNSLGGVTDYAISLADATWEDIEAMSAVPGVTQDAADAMYIYYIQKLMASSGFTSANDIQELASVIKALQIAGTAWGKYYSARANYQALSNASVGDTVSLVNLKTGEAYEKTIKSQKQLNHYLEYQNNIMNSNKTEGLEQMTAKVGDFGAKVKKTADDASSDASDKADEIEDKYESLLDAEITVLEKQLDAQLITYGDYLDKRLALLEDYHNKGLISEQKYYEGLADTYQSEIDNYDKAISAVDKVIEDKIDALEKQKEALEDANDAQVKALEKQQDILEDQKKALEDKQDELDKQKDALDDQIDALEDQKEALEDANQKREDAIELQKALYDLEKAQTQKTRLVYSNGQMVYKSDASSIRDAQDNLDDITYEKKVDAIDDAIDALNDQIDALDDQVDALDDEIDKIDDEIDKLDDEIDKLNDALELQTDALDKQIDALNDYKDKWDEIANAWQDAQNIAVANQILGDNWQNQVLALDTTPIENFKNAYVGAQDQMALANEKAAEAAVVAAQKELEAAQSASSGTQSAVAGATNSLDNYIDVLDGDEPKESEETEESTSTSVTGASEAANDAVSDFTNSTIISGIQSIEAGKDIYSNIPKIDDLKAAFQELNEDLVKTGGLFEALSDFNFGSKLKNAVSSIGSTLKSLYNNYVAKKAAADKGVAYLNGTVGDAFADGYPGLKHDTLALTSEYGQPEMIVTPDGHWQVTTTPTLQNLPKDTVIFNEEQTSRIVKGKGNAFANGTGAKITPLAEADTEKFKTFSNISAMLINTDGINIGIKDINKSLAQINDSIIPKAQGNNNNSPQVTFGNITVNCPGVTEAEVAKNLPNALQSAFSGLALNAYQQSMKR